MSDTLKVMADRRRELDSIIAAGEVLNMKFDGGKKTLSLRASKILHLMVSAAGSDLGHLNEIHSIPIKDMNDTMHLTKEEFFETARELFACTVRFQKTKPNGRMQTAAGPLLGGVWRDDDDPLGYIAYALSPILIEVLKTSNHWAVLSRQAVMAFQSRYSLRLYELISLRIRLDHVHEETFSIDDLRGMLGIPDGKVKLWADIRRFIVEPAIAEVNQLTGLAVTYKPIKHGRAVAGIKLNWRTKEATERAAAAAELDRSSVGRQARRDGTVEIINEAVSSINDPNMAAALRRIGEAAAAKWKAE